MTELEPDPVGRFREFVVEQIRPLITGLGIVRGDLKAFGEWQDGKVTVTVRDVAVGDVVHVGSLAVGEPFAPRIVASVQSALDHMGIERQEAEAE